MKSNIIRIPEFLRRQCRLRLGLFILFLMRQLNLFGQNMDHIMPHATCYRIGPPGIYRSEIVQNIELKTAITTDLAGLSSATISYSLKVSSFPFFYGISTNYSMIGKEHNYSLILTYQPQIVPGMGPYVSGAYAHSFSTSNQSFSFFGGIQKYSLFSRNSALAIDLGFEYKWDLDYSITKGFFYPTIGIHVYIESNNPFKRKFKKDE